MAVPHSCWAVPHQLQLLLHCLPNLGPNENFAMKPNRSKVEDLPGIGLRYLQRASNSCCCVLLLPRRDSTISSFYLFKHCRHFFLSIAMLHCLSLAPSLSLSLSRSAGAFPIFPFADAALQICIGQERGGREEGEVYGG